MERDKLEVEVLQRTINNLKELDRQRKRDAIFYRISLGFIVVVVTVAACCSIYKSLCL